MSWDRTLIGLPTQLGGSSGSPLEAFLPFLSAPPTPPQPPAHVLSPKIYINKSF